MFTHVEENNSPLPLKTLRFKEVSTHVQLARLGSCGIEMLKSTMKRCLSTMKLPLPKERWEKQPGHPCMAPQAPRPSAPESPHPESPGHVVLRTPNSSSGATMLGFNSCPTLCHPQDDTWGRTRGLSQQRPCGALRGW